MNPGIREDFDISIFIHRHDVSASDLRENALFLTDIFVKDFHLSTLSLDSIEKENDERLDFFLYDSLNDDESSGDEHHVEETFLLESIAYERQRIEQLTRRCSSLDSLDNDDQTKLSNRSKPSGMFEARKTDRWMMWILHEIIRGKHFSHR